MPCTTSYAAIAISLSAGEVDAEDDARTRVLRACTNFVKAVLVDVAVRVCPAKALQVFDVACGRGQDIPKLFYALRDAGKTLDSFHGTDICDEALTYARGVAAKFFPECPARFTVEPAYTYTKSVPDTVDIVTCHLALHYWCDAAHHVDAFFANCAQCMARNPRGLLLLSFPDGRWIVRRGRAAAAAAAATEHTAADTAAETAADTDISFETGPISVTVPRSSLALLQKPPAPYGMPYTFTLGRRRVVASREYLVHEGDLLRRAAVTGFAHVAVSKRLDEAVKLCSAIPKYAAMAAAMHCAAEVADATEGHEALPGLDLYRFVVLAKNPETARMFMHSLTHPEP